MFINLTPHDINVYGPHRQISDGPVDVYPASGQMARIVTIELGSQDGYELIEYGRLEGLPSKEPGKIYIVSLVCALAVRGRDDVLAPYVEVRNEAGTMVGCRFLQKVC